MLELKAQHNKKLADVAQGSEVKPSVPTSLGGLLVS
ncbi:hypothetical protein IGI37_003717 [Enterococcus sp. AZ194]